MNATKNFKEEFSATACYGKHQAAIEARVQKATEFMVSQAPAAKPVFGSKAA